MLEGNDTHLFIDDSCPSCRYLRHAFHLLNLPVHSMRPDEVQAMPLDARLQKIVFLCEQTLQSLPDNSDHLAQLAEKNRLIVAVASSLKTFASFSYTPLKTPFTIYELQTAITVSKQSQDEFDKMHPALDLLVGRSQVMNQLKAMMMQVAPYNTRVLIQGESGVGKDMVANCIHQLSTRNKNRFVPVNCGAIPAELMESELFGHEKGAFTGAHCRKHGRFELASHGTLFLDEIAEMPFAMQVKLLRVIQENQIERVGGTVSIDVDVRLIAATNKHIEQEIEANRFREDLYYRLNVFPIFVPSLRTHPEDLPLLIENHLKKIQTRLHKHIALSPEALALLANYHWPGNIRELSNFLERMVVLYPDQVITPDLIDARYRPENTSGDPKRQTQKEGVF